MQLINYENKMREIKACDKIQYLKLCDLLGIQNGNLRLNLRTMFYNINTKTWQRKRFLSIVSWVSCFVMERNFLLTIHDAFICAISSRTTVGNLNTCNMMITRDKWNPDDKQYSSSTLQSNRYQMVRINGNFGNLWSIVCNYKFFH